MGEEMEEEKEVKGGEMGEEEVKEGEMVRRRKK